MATTDPLAALVPLEGALFRAGQVARRLIAEHPELTVTRSKWHTYSRADSYAPPSAEVGWQVYTDGLDGARAWAAVLGAELALKTSDAGAFVFETGHCTVEVDGVEIEVDGSRMLTDTEAVAWRAAQAGGEG
ncbi:hypothetical protein CF54_04185 [Streptomyces sp. Tu 6176]|uniref:hypothetical protein n=1 Tax=Streptomyces sp. Tu 6176 TaxID=1470557 RepID=UPI0004460050|nr:hypothetical protein [Streptomyces sp. Tu 6176]EYT83976.1 hypothetical protein CF54_04185 [Streptomyces sp. Tu 6176]